MKFRTRSQAVARAIRDHIRVLIPCSSESLADACVKEYTKLFPKVGWKVQKQVTFENGQDLWSVHITPMEH